jgi:propionyl-CoA carboxylase alpha chain
VAQGVALPPRPPAASGHAIEARLYAEDPADGYRPASGPVLELVIPDVATRFAPPPGRAASGLRLDSGVEAGSEVSPHYDPMLAKLIAWAPARPTAARLLASTLDRARIHGPATNRGLLAGVLRDPAFLAGQADTSFLNGYDLASLVPSAGSCRLSAAAAALAGAAANRSAARFAAGLPGGWRNVVSQPQRASFDGPRGRVEIAYQWQRDGIALVPETGPAAAAPDPMAAPDTAARPDPTVIPDPTAGEAIPGLDTPVVVAAAPDHAVLEVAGVRYRFDVTRSGGAVWVDSAFGHVRLVCVPRLPEPAVIAKPGSLVAPMPGNVVRIDAAVGQQLSAGQPVLVIEAMKMEHQIAAPADGRLTEIRVAAGDQVQAGDVLATVAAEPTGEDT